MTLPGGFRVYRIVHEDRLGRTVERFARSRGDTFYARWSTSRYERGERYTSWALDAGRFRRTLRFHKTRVR